MVARKRIGRIVLWLVGLALLAALAMTAIPIGPGELAERRAAARVAAERLAAAEQELQRALQEEAAARAAQTTAAQDARQAEEGAQRQGATANATPPPRGKVAQPAFVLPDFPWPPPEPSAEMVLPRSIFAAPAPRTLADVADRLTQALSEASYAEHSYYSAPNGFALVARLERMAADGTPLPEQLRFVPPEGQEPFSFAAYVSQLFFAPEGFYRLIVFVVTDRSFAATGAPMRSAEAVQMLREGANMLTDEYRSLPFTAAHGVTALIYEFRKGARDGEVATLTPGRLGAATHLERARIAGALGMQ